MTDHELSLILTTARVLRAHLTDLRGTLDDDIAVMSEALEPFEAGQDEPINEVTP